MATHQINESPNKRISLSMNLSCNDLELNGDDEEPLSNGHHHNGHNGHNGINGQNGHNEHNGANGHNGHNGHNGNNGHNGHHSDDENLLHEIVLSSHQVIKFSEYLDEDIADFQYVNQFIKHLPYFNKIKANAFSEIELIKTNLAKSLLLNEIRPGLAHWTNRLQTYINEYGLFFTKSDHIRFVKIYLEIISTPDIDLVVVDLCFSILVELLKKCELLSRDDLVIDWRPIYKLYLRVHKIDERSSNMSPENIEQISFVNLISFARIFFDINATAEMLEEWRPLMCPFDMSMNDAFERFNLFLPTLFAQDETKNTIELWLFEFLDLWLVFSGKAVWESNMINLFSRVASDNVGRFDWTPYIPHIFSKTLRGLGLTIADEISLNIEDNTPKDSLSFVNSLSETFSYSEVDIDSIGTWIVSMIGSGSLENRNMCMQHIKHLFFILRSYYHPSNSGSIENLFSLLQRLPEALIERIRFEKLKKHEWVRNGRSADSYITTSDIEELVLALKDIVLMSIFSKTNFNDAIKTFQYLCFLRSDIMLPPLIDQFYSVLEDSESEVDCTHRYTPMLACLISVPKELVSFNPRYPGLQKHTIPLLRSVLPGIDINDLNKFILTFQFLSNVLGNVLICDCSAAIDIRQDLNDYEKELCLLTTQFEDFITELFNKIFDFVDHLANDNSSDSSAAAAVAASIYSRNNTAITDDNVNQVHVIQMLKVLIGQSSKAILKLIVTKLYKFINGNSYNFKSGDILASLIGFLVASGYGKEAFEKFFDYVYGNLMRFKDSKNYVSFIQCENGDTYIMWNLHIFSHLLKASGLILVDHITKIKEIFHWYRSSVNKDCISHLTSCYNNMINSLTRIYPKESCSVQYSLVFDDETEFFSKHLPIRDWGLYISVNELNIEHHIPSVKEIETALEIVGSSLTESMSFLKKSIFFSKRDELLNSSNKQSKIAKEENYRELNYIYHIMYGASCLLKRPVNREFITDHIDSNVQIGLNENINKGLGFEFLNINCSDHEYSKLSVEGKDVLLNMRQTLIEFTIKLADKLIDEKSNDTNLLILISRILTTACSIFGIFASEFEKTWKSHFVNKSTIQNKLILKKYPREEIIRRVNLQYMYRCFHLHISLIDLDFKSINILTNLSINSLFEIVREEARVHLFELLGQFPYSALTILPTIVKFLNKTSNDSKKSTKEQLEGCLLLLKGNNKQTSMLIKQNWFILSKLWPSLFKCKNFDKESIQALLDKIFFNANLNFNSFDNRVRLSENLVNMAFELYSYAADSYSSDELRLKLYNQKCNYENHLISKLMEDLIYIAKDSSITWKNQEISLFSLIFLLNSCESHKKLLTYDCVELFVSCLVHENVNLRRIAVDALCIILKMVKHKKEIKECDTVETIQEMNNQLSENEIAVNTPRPGYRIDNNWYLYDPNYINIHCINENDIAAWERSKFLDKSYWGYYCWPKTLKLNLNKRNTFSYIEIETSSSLAASDEYVEAVKPIREKFQYDSDFVKKFIKLSTIETVKGGEKYDKKRFYLFKALFRNFGTLNIFNNLFEHLTALVSEKSEKSKESCHKLAAEILSGCIRGSKYWNLNVLKYVWSKMKPLLDLIMENICSETLGLWIDCFSNSFEDQDPRRMTFYLNYFQDLMIDVFYEINKSKIEGKQLKPSLKHTNILNLLTALNQFEWRIPLLWSNLTDSFISNMSHPNKSIRELMPSCAMMAITSDIDYTCILNRKNIGGEKSSSRSSLDRLSNDNYSNSPYNYKYDDNFNKFISQIEMRLLKSIDLHDLINDDSNMEVKKELQRNNIDELLAGANFLQTLLNFLILYLSRSLQPLNLEIMRLIPSLCKVDKLADENTRIKLAALRMLISIWSLDKNCISLLIEELCEIAKMKNWRSRVAAIQIIKNFCIFNIFLLDEETKELMRELAISLVVDENLEVRSSACLCLSGFFHSSFIDVDSDLIERFKHLANIDIKVKDMETGKIYIDQSNMAKKHGGILGLCSLVNSSPYEVPDFIPDVIAFLCQFVNSPSPIQDSVKKCLNEFKRTHHDNWQEHKRKFNESQLLALSEVLISSPSFYL